MKILLFILYKSMILLMNNIWEKIILELIFYQNIINYITEEYEMEIIIF